MFSEWKIYAAVAFVLGLAGAVCWWGAHEYHAGAASVQAKWDAASVAAAQQQAKNIAQAKATEEQQSSAFVGIDSDFQKAIAHVSTPDPSIAGLLSGAVSLQPIWQCPSAQPSTGVSKAAAASMGRDAAATQALADRVQSAARVIGYADDADTRERILDAQLIAAQRLLQAERATSQ